MVFKHRGRGDIPVAFLICAPLLAATIAGVARGVPPRCDAPESLPGGDDLWGLSSKGDLVAPRRDDANEIHLEFGWPGHISSEAPLWGRSPAVVDIDRNGDWEIAVVNGDGQLFVFQHDGAFYPGFPTPLHRGDRPEPREDPTHRAIAAVSDVDRDGSPDLAFAADIGYLHAVGQSHREPRPFPLDIGRGRRFSAVAAMDVTGDQESELIFTSFPVRPIGGEEALLHVITGSGEELEGWPVRCGFGSGSSPAVGDIDGDGEPEIVVGSARVGGTPGQMWAFRLDGTRAQGFPLGTYETIGGSPALAQLDGQGGYEIVFAAKPLDGPNPALFVVNASGRVAPVFLTELPSSHPFGSPTVYFNIEDGRYSHIAFGSFDPGGDAAITLTYLSLADSDYTVVVFTGSPAVVGSVVSADVAPDRDGDALPDLVAALAPAAGQAGRIGAWNYLGRELDGFPIDLADYGGGAFASSPTLWDVDRDGFTEIIAVTTDGRLFVWHTDGRFGGDTWPTERGDFARTGVKPARTPIGVTELDKAATRPQITALDAYPNPFNSSLYLAVRLPQPGRFNAGLYDLGGRRVASVADGLLPAGERQIVVNSGNFGLAPGVYFVRWSAGGASGSRRIIYLP